MMGEKCSCTSVQAEKWGVRKEGNPEGGKSTTTKSLPTRRGELGSERASRKIGRQKHAEGKERRKSGAFI